MYVIKVHISFNCPKLSYHITSLDIFHEDGIISIIGPYYNVKKIVPKGIANLTIDMTDDIHGKIDLTYFDSLITLSGHVMNKILYIDTRIILAEFKDDWAITHDIEKDFT